MIGYLDLPSGLSGDMFLGCLLDAGWPIDRLRSIVQRLKLQADEWSVDARSIMKGPLRATLADVRAAEGHVHRHLADVRQIIEAADLTDSIKARAVRVFQRLAEAEARVHGTTPDRIHFHEVGAVDAIIDIVGVCAGLEELGIERLYASAVPAGPGWVRTQHGLLPLPAPATLEILAAAKAPLCAAPSPEAGELVTPTGAALLAALATWGQPGMSLEKVAVGAGRRELPWPNVARLWLGQAQPGGRLVQLETNIDDMNPQLYGAVRQKLFAAGARDVWFTPIQMKKDRPGVMLSALGNAIDEAALGRVILQETTTLGVRVLNVSHRHEAQRQMAEVHTPYGPVQAKVKVLDGRPAGAMPEYDDCVRVAEAANVPVKAVYDAALAAAQTLTAC